MRLHPDDGMTLVELLVAVAILGILTVALTSALFVTLRSTNDTRTGLAQSNGEQLLAHYLQKDVDAACNSSPTTVSGSTVPAVPTGCGSQNPGTTPTTGVGTLPQCSSTGSFTINALSATAMTAAQPASDVAITYSLSSAVFQRASAGQNITLASNVACIDAWYPTTGSCVGQFRVDVQVNGGTGANAQGPYSYSVCAHGRAG